MQESFLLIPAFEKGGKKYKDMKYVSDFFFQDDMKVVDIKGFETPSFKIKQKLFDFHFKDYQLITLTRCPKWLANELRADVRWIETNKLKKLRKFKGQQKKFQQEANLCVVDYNILAII